MATAVLNPFFISISGRIGGIVFYRRKNTQCIRTYVVPRNPDTISQRNARRSFADAVNSWQRLSVVERYKYSTSARGTNMSGYNLYISEYMRERVSNRLKWRIKKSLYDLVDPYAYQIRIHSVPASIFNRFRGLASLRALHRCREPA